MTSFLYISYSLGLTEEEKFIYDKSVFKNKEDVYIFIRSIKSNLTDKTKKLIIGISLSTIIWYSSLESV